MSNKSIKLTLPDAIYKRVLETAESLSLSFDDVLKQSIALSLPELEKEIPTLSRPDLSAMPLFSDKELWKIARSSMAKKKETKLEDLAELKKQRQLTDTEKLYLNHLIDEAQGIMLRKAEAYRLLARRGYKVFTASIHPTR